MRGRAYVFMPCANHCYDRCKFTRSDGCNELTIVANDQFGMDEFSKVEQQALATTSAAPPKVLLYLEPGTSIAPVSGSVDPKT